MQKFPVSSSTLSAAHVGWLLQSNYGFGADAVCTLLKTGINHSYRIEDAARKAVFRVYSLNWRSRAEISEEVRLLNNLRDEGISVSCALGDNTGNYIQELDAPEGMRYGVLFTFAEGEKHLNFSAALHYKAGETMARIHRLTENLQLQRVTYTPAVLVEDPLGQIRNFLLRGSDEMKWLESTHKYLLIQLAGTNTSLVRHGIVHMDIWFDNFNITQDGEINLFDFDFCGNGWLCLDIAYYILQLHSTEKIEVERDEKLKNFIAGYESVTLITDEEKRLLPLLGVCMYYFYLGVQCQRFDNWSNVFLNETYLKRFINLLVKKYFDENVIAINTVNPS